jgi:hypothetical protein
MPGHDRYWHLTDKPTAPGFVGFWTNNGQMAALGLNGLFSAHIAEVGGR